ncbi:MAG: hypothetical protein LBN33_02975 [Desulfovibrio sp.]|jgi:hypothetical protein|nr:hypothetical protein [Desulfovibrio sp.]
MRITSLKKMLIAFIAFALCSISSVALADEYNVFCRAGKITVDQRTAKQMNQADKSAVLIKSFKFRTDAEKHAKTLGGVGAKCSNK